MTHRQTVEFIISVFCFALSPVEKPTTSTFHEQCQSAIETPTNSQEVITAKSPHVQGGVHEECSWFLVDEARIKSPAFKQVYQTWQFQDILLSVSKGET